MGRDCSSDIRVFRPVLGIWYLAYLRKDIAGILGGRVLASETRSRTHFHLLRSKNHFYKQSTSAASESESREQNSAPESRRASLRSVKFIKMSRLTIYHCLFLRSLHGPLRCCKTDCETDCTTSFSLNTQDIETGQLRWTRHCIRNPCIFRVGNLFSASDRNHASRPNADILTYPVTLQCPF